MVVAALRGAVVRTRGGVLPLAPPGTGVPHSASPHVQAPPAIYPTTAHAVPCCRAGCGPRQRRGSPDVRGGRIAHHRRGAPVRRAPHGATPPARWRRRRHPPRSPRTRPAPRAHVVGARAMRGSGSCGPWIRPRAAGVNGGRGPLPRAVAPPAVAPHIMPPCAAPPGRTSSLGFSGEPGFSAVEARRARVRRAPARRAARRAREATDCIRRSSRHLQQSCGGGRARGLGGRLASGTPRTRSPTAGERWGGPRGAAPSRVQMRA